MWQTLLVIKDIASGQSGIYVSCGAGVDGRSVEFLNESHSQHARGRIRGYMLFLRRHGRRMTYHRLICFDTSNLQRSRL
jgi:hypothetical protein